jgi:hypothetical protein
MTTIQQLEKKMRIEARVVAFALGILVGLLLADVLWIGLSIHKILLK